MKSTLITILIILSFQLLSQDLEHIKPYHLNDEGRMYYDLILEMPEMNKNDLFQLSEIWIAKAFKDGKEVKMYSDVESGTLIGNGSVDVALGTFQIISSTKEWLDYRINIFCKEGKARIVIDDITSSTSGNSAYNSSNVPIENMYFKRGDTTKKARKGFAGFKSKYLRSIASIAYSWKNAIEGGEISDYSDF